MSICIYTYIDTCPVRHVFSCVYVCTIDSGHIETNARTNKEIHVLLYMYVNVYACLSTYIQVDRYRCIWSAPYDTQTSSKRWSDFGSFLDAAVVSNKKAGETKDPRLQQSTNPT